MTFFSTTPPPVHGRWAACLLVLGLIFVLPAGLAAQGTEEDYRGVWQVTPPESGPLILIIKKNNRASYFWGSNSDRTVYQGTWSPSEDGVALDWTGGGTHRIVPGSPGFEAIFLDANDAEQYRVPAQRVPEEVLGQWARPPEVEDDLRSDRDEAEGFFGIWEISGESGTEYVFIEPDRSAASTWAGSSADTRGLRGAWARQGSELHLVWDTGHYSILSEGTRAFNYVRLDPGTEIEDQEVSPIPTRRKRDADVDAAWLAAYEAEKALESTGISFSSSNDAQRFYRGDWIVKRGETRFERISIGRFGGLSTSRKAGLDGEWRLSGQDLFMRWDDGMRKILSPVGDGFVLYEYRAGRPLDGVPTRIYPATPADSGKLDAYLTGRSQVAEQIHTLAEAAGIQVSREKAGWGRTFMRWAWPFGGDSSDASAETLLEDSFEGSDDPWWWPFWSEQAAPASIDDAPDTPDSAVEDPENGTSGTPEMVEIPLPSAPADDGGSASGEAEAPAETQTPPPHRKRGSWLWPF